MFDTAYFTDFIDKEWQYQRLSFLDVDGSTMNGFYMIDWITGKSSFTAMDGSGSYFSTAFERVRL